jgi:hypothetical protein
MSELEDVQQDGNPEEPVKHFIQQILKEGEA